jgi:type II secretory pathway component PulF
VHGVVSHRFMGEWSAGSGPRSIAVVTGTSLALLAAATWIVSYTLRRLRLRPFGRTVCLARALRLTGIFTASGLPAPAALRRAAQASSHRRVAHGLGAVAARLEAGEVSADAWAPLALPQALTLRLGAMRPRDLGGTLADLAQRLAARHHRRQDRMLRWVQPASVLVVAGAVLLEYSVVIDVIETARDAARLW